MKILYVVNNLYAPGNGLSASARRTIRYLKAEGAEVRALSGANPDPAGKQPEYVLKDLKIPVFDPLIKKQGYTFAASDAAVIRDAVEWADIVHLEEPFVIQVTACGIAEELGKPCTATYHLHPENLYSSIHMRKDPFLNNSTMRLWRDLVFNRCRMIQCPTENVRARLEKWHFKPELRVISNGMVPLSRSERGQAENAPGPKAFYTVLCTGRYSVEKDQLTLLRTMKYSAFADRIRLVFAGRGPMEKRLKEEAAQLFEKGIVRTEPVFCFCTQQKLKALYAETDLYVHCATVEVEGLSCMEALQTGIVPVIAEGPITATSQFALSERSVFPMRKPKALAERIDWWFSHDAERIAEAEKYTHEAEAYDIRLSAKLLMRMYEDVLKG